MKLGPLTFQCACLVCVCRSMASASRAFSSSIALTRVASGTSFFVLNISGLLVEGFEGVFPTGSSREDRLVAKPDGRGNCQDNEDRQKQALRQQERRLRLCRRQFMQDRHF